MSIKNDNINIIYSSIFREKHTILSEYTECSGNFSQIMTHIMKEVIMKFENPPIQYRTYFYYGKYAIFLIKYQKLYIIIMFPNTKIQNNEIIFALLYSIFEKLNTQKDIDLEKISKMKAYSLSQFTKVFKEQINEFNSNCNKFIQYLKYGNQFIVFEPFEDRYFDSQIELPILSNEQVHDDKKLNSNDDNNISNMNTLNSIYSQDTFRDDILNQKEKLIDDNNGDNLIKENTIEDTNLILKEKNKSNTKCLKKNYIILISIIVLILIGILLGLYFSN